MLTVEIRRTEDFKDWLSGLRDSRARGKIFARIDRLGLGNAGDCEPVGSGVSEMRIHYGPGYRVYFVTKGETLIVLLAGGDKSTQQSDIARAIALAGELEF